MEQVIRRAVFFALIPLILAACGSGDASTSLAKSLSANGSEPAVSRNNDFAQVSRGGKVFVANCAECHGNAAEGAPNWRQRNQQGKYPAPPLNGSGHTWHHPYKTLTHTINNGSPGGQGDMPAWANKLTDQEIEDVMAWFISRWPDQVYDAWYRMDKKGS